jgi:hypothetical protein
VGLFNPVPLVVQQTEQQAVHQLVSRISPGVLGNPGNVTSYPKGPLFSQHWLGGGANPLLKYQPVHTRTRSPREVLRHPVMGVAKTGSACRGRLSPSPATTGRSRHRHPLSIDLNWVYIGRHANADIHYPGDTAPAP